MFKVFFQIIVDFLATVVQILCSPVNALISSTVPNFSDKIVTITSSISSIVSSLAWPLSALPSSVKITLIFIFTCEVAKHTIFKSTYALVRVWTLIQRIKFW